jgi:hypothetical protein
MNISNHRFDPSLYSFESGRELKLFSKSEKAKRASEGWVVWASFSDRPSENDNINRSRNGGWFNHGRWGPIEDEVARMNTIRTWSQNPGGEHRVRGNGPESS